jgi:hypothetical protein
MLSTIHVAGIVNKAVYIFVHLFLAAWTMTANSQEALTQPEDEETRAAVSKASNWLTAHVRAGRLTVNDREVVISVIAWKDPTLNPELPSRLAGYAITDTLWASYALTLTQPEMAKELKESLQRIDCPGNSLHEVIWRPITSIGHKPVDNDLMHGRSLGIMSDGDETIDVRTFTVVTDREFEVGHPLLFAEHAAYQSLYEFRLGKQESAKNRLRTIFRKKAEAAKDSNPSENPVRWQHEHGLLVDYVIQPEYSKFKKGESSTCRQYAFKLAVLLYTCRLLGLNSEFPDELDLMHRRLMAAQLPSGGIPHFYDIDSTGTRVMPCPDATGEATAIFMLAETVVEK